MPASNSSAPPLDQDIPLPTGLNTTFLFCVNTTIGASVPLMDATKHGLSGGIIAMIVILSIAGALSIISIIYWLYRRHRVKQILRFAKPTYLCGIINLQTSLGKSGAMTMSRRRNPGP